MMGLEFDAGIWQADQGWRIRRGSRIYGQGCAAESTLITRGVISPDRRRTCTLARLIGAGQDGDLRRRQKRISTTNSTVCQDTAPPRAR